MSSVTNVRRVHAHLREFYDVKNDEKSLEMSDPPLAYSTANRDQLKLVRQYSKESLQLLSQAVQDRASDVLREALKHADENLINEKVLNQIEEQLYSFNK